MTIRDLPNIISILRILLVWPVAVFLLEGNFLWALILFVIAGVSDGIDGYLARKLDSRSQLGAILDPFADKLLMLVCYLSLGWLNHVPVWLVAAVIGRDIVIVAGASVIHYMIERIEVQPSLISKINTVFQILLVIMLLVDLSGLTLPEQLMRSMIWLVLVTTVASGIGYIVEGIRLAKAGREQGKQSD